MTRQEQLDNLRRQIANLSPERALFFATNNLVDEYHKRIFVESKKTDGGTIQYVSDNPVYISKDKTPKSVEPYKGKTGKTKFASGKSHISTYFDSYAAFKKRIGRPILELFGTLQSSIANGTKKLNDNTYILAVPGKEGDKIEGLQYGNGHWSGFGTIFKFTEKEKQIFYDTFAQQMIKQVNGTANS